MGAGQLGNWDEAPSEYWPFGDICASTLRLEALPIHVCGACAIAASLRAGLVENSRATSGEGIATPHAAGRGWPALRCCHPPDAYDLALIDSNACRLVHQPHVSC